MRNKMKRLIMAMVLTLCSIQVHAYSIDNVQVVRHGDRYLITFTAQINAPSEQVKNVIYNFEEAPKLMPAVRKTEVFRFDDNTARVRAVMRPCVFLFCKTMSKLTIVNLEDDYMRLTGIEDAGSFRYTEETVKFKPQGNGTALKYKGDMSPKFYVPSWMGVHFVRGAVRKYLAEALQNIESRANGGS